MRTTFFFLILLTSLTARAQRSIARLVMANSDTLVGKARLEYDTVVFRSSSGEKTIYNSKEVKSVVIDGDTYLSSDYLKLPLGNNKNSFFVKALTSGDVLLYYKDDDPRAANSQPSFFISKSGSDIIELQRLEKKTFKDGNWYTQSYDAYKNQIKDLFKDCTNQSIDYQKNFFTESLMMKKVEQYAKCKGLTLKRSSAPEQPSLAVSFLAGLDYSHITFSSQEYAFRYLNNVSSFSTMPFLGFRAEMPLKRGRTSKFITETMLKITSIQFNGYKISVTYFKLNIGGEKIIPINNKMSVDLHGGLSLNPIIGTSFSSNDPNNTTFGFKTFELGLWYGAGISFGKLGIFVRNENFMGGFTNYINVSMTESCLFAGLKYKLK